MYFLSRVTLALSAPGTALMSLLVLGVILSWSRWARAGRWVVTAATLGFVAVAVLPVDSWLVTPLEARFPRVNTLPDKVDGIIVLGSAVDPVIQAGHPLPSLSDAGERLTAWVTLARLYPTARLVFADRPQEPEPDAPSEDGATRKLLAGLGLDANRVTFERESRNTFETAVVAKRLMAPKPGETWVVITSASHIPRTIGVFRHVGWTVEPYPVGYKANPSYTLDLAEHLRTLEWALHEWIGLAAYRVLGRTDTLFPGP